MLVPWTKVVAMEMKKSGQIHNIFLEVAQTKFAGWLEIKEDKKGGNQ